MLKFLIKKAKSIQNTDERNEDEQSSKHKPQTQQEYFNNILAFAETVINNTKNQEGLYKKFYFKGNEHPILDVVRLVGKTIQTKYLTSLLHHKDETSLTSLLPGELFFDARTYLAKDGKTINDFKKEVVTTKEIELCSDLIIPWPWKRERLINTICNIGENREWGKWEQDKYNHYTELWLPMGIIWVEGGNHSISSGMLQGIGTLKPTHTYDISEIYEYIYTDGKNYYMKGDDSIVSKVVDIDFAALFEIGRLLKKNSISF